MQNNNLPEQECDATVQTVVDFVVPTCKGNKIRSMIEVSCTKISITGLGQRSVMLAGIPFYNRHRPCRGRRQHCYRHHLRRKTPNEKRSEIFLKTGDATN